MTNFEKINAMDEYALAEFLADIGDKCTTHYYTTRCVGCVLGKCFNCSDYDDVREWLESEVDDSDS